MAQVIKGNLDETAGARAAVLKLADFASEARNLVLEARKQAARIVADGRAHVEDFRRQASETGYGEGYERGMEEGLARGQAQAREEAARAVQAELAESDKLALGIAQALTEARQQLLQEARRGLLRLAVEIAQKIVGRVAVTAPAAAEHNLAKALELARCASELTVLVHPEQLDRLNQYKKTLVESLAVRGQVRLVGDARIQPGGVKVVSRWGEIDATIQTQLTNVVEAMLGYSQAAPASAGGTVADLPAGQAGSSPRPCSGATAASDPAVPPGPADAGPSADPAGLADLSKLQALAQARAVGGLFEPAQPTAITGVTGRYISSAEAAAALVGLPAEIEPPFVVQPPDEESPAPGWDVEERP